MQKIEIIYNNIILINQKSFLILVILIRNKFAIKYKLYISLNGILAKSILFI